MAIAHIGPLTTVLEVAATAVGAGAVLGSVATGIRGLWARRPIREIERHALTGGYAGGAAGALSVIVDAILRYGIPK